MTDLLAVLASLTFLVALLFLTVGAWAIGIVRIFSWVLGI